MEIMFMNIVGGIMIDSFSELKEEDSARNEDKETYCYICSMDKPAVFPLLSRWKERDPPSSSTPGFATSYGTISTTFTASDLKAPPTSQVLNTKSIRKSMNKMSSGSPPWVRVTTRARPKR